MQLIDELIEQLTDRSYKLADVLIKAKVLAFKLKSEEIASWINSEINGYSEENIPSYRKIPTRVIGTITNGFYRESSIELPLSYLSENEIEDVSYMKLNQSISSIENFTDSKEGSTFAVTLPHYLYPKFSKSFDGGYVVQTAQKEIQKHQVVQLLSIIKSKLVDFMLELNDTVGGKEDMKKVTKETDEKISSLFNSTMFGNNTTIIIGNDNVQKVNNNSKFTFDSLRKKFEDNGMKKEDVDELAKIIDNDNPNNEKRILGEKVQLWMSKMLAKAMNASWEISLSAAGNLLSDGIESYYHWNK